MLDSNGANTTAAAAVLAAGQHVELSGAVATVLGATGPVGQRVTRLLAREGTKVRVASRDIRRAQALCNDLAKVILGATLAGYASDDAESLAEALDGSQVVISAGAAGAQLLPAEIRRAARSLQVAIDLNAVPPVGLEGIEPQDKATKRDGQLCFGGIGVGGMKMKIHKAAIGRLFEANDLVLDAEEIYTLAKAKSG
jgi:glutamyl-tRNA reductase